MRCLINMFLWIILLSGSFSPLSHAAVNTFVFTVGSNTSTEPKLEDLKFAESDAEKFADAMANVGGVPSDRIWYLENANLSSLTSELIKIKKLVGEKDQENKSRFIFYFSGHADESGLHLKDGILPKAKLHKLLGNIPSPTKVAILDTCFSGALASKGVKVSPAFELPKVMLDTPTGSVFLSASSGKQLAYESEKLSGGIFTHHLLEGLYGKADDNSDGLVTIDELYQYVYRTTKMEAISLPAKYQDPSFNADLKGQGAIVMSFPTKNYSALELKEDISGEINIISKKGMMFLKQTKIDGIKKKLFLPIGSYRISVSKGKNIGQASFLIQKDRNAQIALRDLEWNQPTDSIFKRGITLANTPTPVIPLEKANNKNLWSSVVSFGVHSGYGNELESQLAPLVSWRISKPTWGAYKFYQIFTGARIKIHRDESNGYPRQVKLGLMDDFRRKIVTNSITADINISPRFTLGSFSSYHMSLGFILGLGASYHDQRIHPPDGNPPSIKAGTRTVGDISSFIELGIKDGTVMTGEFGVELIAQSLDDKGIKGYHMSIGLGYVL